MFLLAMFEQRLESLPLDCVTRKCSRQREQQVQTLRNRRLTRKWRSTKEVHAISEGDKGQKAAHECGEVSTCVGHSSTCRLLRAFGDFSAEKGHDPTFIFTGPPGCYVQNRLCGREIRKEVGRRWWWLEPGCHAVGPKWVLDKF